MASVVSIDRKHCLCTEMFIVNFSSDSNADTIPRVHSYLYRIDAAWPLTVTGTAPIVKVQSSCM